MTGDSIELGHHDTNDLRPRRNGNARQSFDRKTVRHFIQHTLEIVDTVRVGNKGMPGLPLGDLLL